MTGFFFEFSDKVRCVLITNPPDNLFQRFVCRRQLHDRRGHAFMPDILNEVGPDFFLERTSEVRPGDRLVMRDRLQPQRVVAVVLVYLSHIPEVRRFGIESRSRVSPYH